MSSKEDFIDKIKLEWISIIESVDFDGWRRPIEKVNTHIENERCYLNFQLEDLCKGDKFIPIDGNNQKIYRKWGNKVITIFEEILGDKEDTIPNHSFTVFKFKSGWGESLEYGVWRLSIVFNINGMIAKDRERKIDNLFK